MTWNETPQDLEAEWKIACFTGKCWDFDPVKRPVPEYVHSIDMEARRNGKLCFFFEVKRCKYARGELPLWAVSYQKVLAGLQLNKEHDLPFYFIVSFNGSLYYLRVTRERISKTQIGGRRDRDQRGDRELMAFFDVYLFRRVEPWER